MSSSALDTPMMRQFVKIKAQYPDAIIFYRMGDFYEMFLDDAELVAPILDITLTTRDRGKPDAVPMCGVPVHAADTHLRRLAELGYRVAICEQVEDPKQTGGKRLVRREVVEVVTPGLVGDPEGLDGRTIVAVAGLFVDSASGAIGVASLDASTADFRATTFQPDRQHGEAPGGLEFEAGELPDILIQELARIAPRELLVPADRSVAVSLLLREVLPDLAITSLANTAFEVSPGAGEWLSEIAASAGAGAQAALGVAHYLAENQPFAIQNPPRLRHYEVSESVVLDAATRRHLELHENSEDRGRSGTLLAELDRTCCALGARRLFHWLCYPLLSPVEIELRQDAVA
ncbi:MAG: DNA mismatch repair protein MutS, partial [Myxococcota bacterium]